MNHRATGLVEVAIVMVAAALGAAFVFLAYQLGNATRPGEMRVWGSTEATSLSTPGATSSAGNPTPTVSASAPVATAAPASGSTAGKAVFDKNCTGCHPGGNKGVGPALNVADLKQRYPNDSDLAKVIRGGKAGGMPSYASAAISDGDLDALISYVRSLSGGASTASVAPTAPVPSPTAGSTTTTAPSPTAVASTASSGGNVAAGKAAFDKNCTGCHPGGKAGVGPAVSGSELKSKFPQDKDLISVIRDGKGGMMPAFASGRLSDDDVSSIVAYLRSLP